MPIRGFHKFQGLAAVFPALQRDPSTRTENVFYSGEIPNEQDLAALGPHTVCEHCDASPMRVVCQDVHGSAAVLVLRCACGRDHFIFVTSEQTTSPDVCIFNMSWKLDSTKSLFAGFRCPACHAPFVTLDIDEGAFDYKPVLPTTMPCSKCHERMNIVFHDTPLKYYQHALATGDQVRSASPAAAIVFYVAALENFLQKSFGFSSAFNLFLVRQRKVGFQDLREAKDVFASFFAVDLVAVAGNRGWELLVEASRRRNFVVHNAGHDYRFNPVTIEDDDAAAVRTAVEALVKKLEPIMREKLVF